MSAHTPTPTPELARRLDQIAHYEYRTDERIDRYCAEGAARLLQLHDAWKDWKPNAEREQIIALTARVAELEAFVVKVGVHFALTDAPLGLEATALLAKVAP